ncbi:D-alanyl-D-alanine carboxypeptidase family protein [Orenia marismortui]|uniref:D-alanyl-D-alanine carboxypeptidase family protein n=1 Tax=Orenia marismortui TaxID=46469 RepID=UPI00036755F0|nr:D-alanyl-D-alanine carboxypeptidase family protein [Orenia marismortui]
MKINRIVILALVLITLLSQVAWASPFENIHTKAAILMVADNGQILFKKNANLKLPPASMSKLMTILLALEAVEKGEASLDDEVRISDLAEGMGGSQIWLAQGDLLTLRDLLKAVTISSANDACVAVAEYIGETEYGFIEMMNNKARELGMENTQFFNTTGLPNEGENNYSTVYDMAILARELVTNYPQVLKWSAQQVDYIKNNDLAIYTTNNLLSDYSYATGLKTGWTEEAKFCLTATASKDDTTLISVLMGAENDNDRTTATIKLLNYGFNAFNKVYLVNSQVKIKEVEVAKGKELKVEVETAQAFSPYILRGTKDQIKQEIKITKSLEAPIKKGELVGKLIFKQQGGKVLGQVDLQTAKDIKRANIFVLIFRWIKAFFMNLIYIE